MAIHHRSGDAPPVLAGRIRRNSGKLALGCAVGLGRADRLRWKPRRIFGFPQVSLISCDIAVAVARDRVGLPLRAWMVGPEISVDIPTTIAHTIVRTQRIIAGGVLEIMADIPRRSHRLGNDSGGECCVRPWEVAWRGQIRRNVCSACFVCAQLWHCLLPVVALGHP